LGADGLSCCISTVEKHASVRHYMSEPVDEKDLEVIVEAARRAPSSWGLQPVTVTVVTDSKLKRRLAEAVGGQEYVALAPVFLVFSIDYLKLRKAAGRLGVRFSPPGFGHLAIAMIDTGIAAGWAAVVAESLGYGTVFIALYSNPCRVADILNLPELVLPVIGLCVGRPAEKPEPRPRQPMEVFAAFNRYVELREDLIEALAGMYGANTFKLYSHVLGEGGYYDSVSRRLYECARARGFRL
jgi:FMN reductase [NAD(P)H]